MQKKLLTFGFLFFSFSMMAQHNGIGLRLGVPTSVTYKYYMNKRSAFEVMLGSEPRGWSSEYYRNSFEDYSEYNDYAYRNHQVRNNVYLQGRYLLHYNIMIHGLEGELDWYWGIGALLKSAKVRYDYWYNGWPGPGNPYRSDTKNDIDFGPEVPLGLEYTFQDIPISVFGELSMLLEIADRPVTPRLFGAAGIRYNF